MITHWLSSQMDPKDKEAIEALADIICEDCNNGHCKSH